MPAPPAREHSAPREIFGSIEGRSADAEKGNRMPLYLGIAAATVALAGFLAWKLMKPQAIPAPAPVVTPTRVAVVPTEAAPASALVATPALDPKAVEAEVQRQLASKRKELEKTAAAATKAEGSAPAAAVPAAVAATAAPEPTAVVPTEEAAAEPTEEPEPTAVPTVPPPPTAVPPPAEVKEAPVQRGDLVGPGPGVVEPAMISPPRVVYPPMARQQRVAGKVVVLVLVDEAGQAADVRLQQGVAGQAAVNTAVVAAVKSAKFRAATKNGIPVKMWRPVIIEVKP